MAQTTAPLDGMWLGGFVPMASHFGLYEGDELIGFCCVNDEGYLLQFFVHPDHQNQSSQLFELVGQGADCTAGNINDAFVSSAEPHYLSLCLDAFFKFQVNALMYQRGTAALQTSTENALALVNVDTPQLSQVVDFAAAGISAPAQ
jgi:hypothetical protein